MDKRTFFSLLIILLGGIYIGIYSQNIFNVHDKTPVNLTQDISSNSKQASLPDFSKVVTKVTPALVNISAVHIVEIEKPFYNFYYGDPFSGLFGTPFESDKQLVPEKDSYSHEGTGSGFIIDSSGYVITNYHVIKNADRIKVKTHDNKKYEADIIGKDPKTDIAVVKIRSSKKFIPVTMGDSDNIKIGTWVIAAGSPFGLQQTYTAGIISAQRQNVHVENNVYRDMLQTDASINQGNSGGPLLDMSGNVIGINTAIFAPGGLFSGIGFAIPVNAAKTILDELIKKGRVVRAWLGIEIIDMNSTISNQFGFSGAEGVLVNHVLEKSPAFKAGIKRGDIIVAIDKNKILDSTSLQDTISVLSPGKNIVVEIVRDKKMHHIKVELSEMPQEKISKIKKYDLKPGQKECRGISVSNISLELQRNFGINTTDGVVVIDVANNTECYDIGLIPGDVILEINRKKINSADEFYAVFSSVNLSSGVVFDVIRRGYKIYISYQKAD